MIPDFDSIVASAGNWCECGLPRAVCNCERKNAIHLEPNEIPKCDLCNRRLTEDYEIEHGLCSECCEDVLCPRCEAIHLKADELYCEQCQIEIRSSGRP